MTLVSTLKNFLIPSIEDTRIYNHYLTYGDNTAPFNWHFFVTNKEVDRELYRKCAKFEYASFKKLMETKKNLKQFGFVDDSPSFKGDELFMYVYCKMQ